MRPGSPEGDEHQLDSMERQLRRVAYDLHDGPVQGLSAALLELEMARKHGACETESPNVRRVQTLLEAAIRELRDISSALCPSALEVEGLLPALEQFLEDERLGHAGIEFVLDTDGSVGDVHLSPSARIALFRIIQESVNNATRHASPTHVVVRLRCTGEDIQCAISDDGSGFEHPLKGVRERACHGLVFMEDRARLLGGGLGISSETSVGTTVSVRLPTWR